MVLIAGLLLVALQFLIIKINLFNLKKIYINNYLSTTVQSIQLLLIK